MTDLSLYDVDGTALVVKECACPGGDCPKKEAAHHLIDGSHNTKLLDWK